MKALARVMSGTVAVVAARAMGEEAVMVVAEVVQVESWAEDTSAVLVVAVGVKVAAEWPSGCRSRCSPRHIRKSRSSTLALRHRTLRPTRSRSSVRSASLAQQRCADASNPTPPRSKPSAPTPTPSTARAVVRLSDRWMDGENSAVRLSRFFGDRAVPGSPPPYFQTPCFAKTQKHALRANWGGGSGLSLHRHLSDSSALKLVPILALLLGWCHPPTHCREHLSVRTERQSCQYVAIILTDKRSGGPAAGGGERAGMAGGDLRDFTHHRCHVV